MDVNSSSISRNILSFHLSVFLLQPLHHVIKGDNFPQSSVTWKLAQVVESEMKIDPWALLVVVQIIC